MTIPTWVRVPTAARTSTAAAIVGSGLWDIRRAVSANMLDVIEGLRNPAADFERVTREVVVRLRRQMIAVGASRAIVEPGQMRPVASVWTSIRVYRNFAARSRVRATH